LTASSRDYGFTEGYSKAEKIALALTGQNIVFARSKEEEENGYRQGLFNILLFKRVHDYYSGGLLPEIKYLKNTLVTDFGLNEDFHNDFYQVYQSNLKFISKFSKTELDTVDVAANPVSIEKQKPQFLPSQKLPIMLLFLESQRKKRP